MDDPAERRRLRFGPFEFDVGSGELYRLGERVRLQEQPRQLLMALLEQPGEIATREALRERLWKTDTFVDFEHGLNTAIKKVRQALGDSADAPTYIETLARRGYRFIAPVASLPARSPGGDVSNVDATGASRFPAVTREQSRWNKRRYIVRGAAALLLTAVAATVWFAQRKTDARTSTAPGQRVELAVMPLRVLGESNSADWAYIGVGVADAITTRLANIRQLSLRPTSVVLPYKDAQSDPGRVAAELGVRHLLLGSIQRTPHTYRVSVQLVGADGVAVWGDAYDEPLAELLELQDRIAEQIVSALRVELSPPERARLHVRYTRNPEAYDLYLRGRALLVNYTEGNMREALDYFERALAVDRDYALARAALATGAAWFSVRYAYQSEALAWGKRADREARRALEQDPSLADAHLAIASAAGTLYGGFDWRIVLQRTAEALALDPSIDLAHVVRMRAFYHLGFFDEAREEAQLARAANPFPNIEIARLEVALHLVSGQFSLAAQQAAELRDRNRSDMPALPHYLGLARYYTGDVAAAREVLASAKRGGEPDVRAQASLASIEAAAGFRDQARARAVAVAKGSYMDHHVAYSLGAAFAQLGEPAESLVWLQRAADSGFPCLPWFEHDTLLDPVRRHPGFARLHDRMRSARDAAIASPTQPQSVAQAPRPDQLP
jgi:TolB-like protein/DNA-binding winged helix-turn-helix (wHTH) protein/Tfp pilus assembly protein PilF